MIPVYRTWLLTIVCAVTLASEARAETLRDVIVEIEETHFEYARDESASFVKVDFNTDRTYLLLKASLLAQSELSQGDAEKLFAVASTIKFALEGQTPELLYDEIFQSLRAKNLVTDRMVNWRHLALVTARRFDAAEILVADHPQLEPAPYLSGASIGAAGGRTLAWEETLRRFLQTAPVKMEEYSIVVIASPYCAFSKAAEAAISGNEELMAAFKAKALWLLPPDYALTQESGTAYSQFQPPGIKRIAYLRSDFPQISSWETPTFYFFQEGELVEKHVGWPPDKSLQNFEKILSIVRGDVSQKTDSHQ